MIECKISIENPHRHFIQFEMIFPKDLGNEVRLQLPAWRPGRYELGNFARNIRDFKVMNLQDGIMSFEKGSKDLWIVKNPRNESFKISYSYYSNVLNAGSTYLDDSQLYINPVNCMFYLNSNEIAYRLSFEIPEDYEIATGMKKESDHVLIAKNYQMLFDCPLIASSSLTHTSYQYKEVVYHLWIQGETEIDLKKFAQDHLDFTQLQVNSFGDIPCEEYHFLYQFPPYAVRHGVEHENSTVISMGPASEMHKIENYKELMGISCHELYHTWNVKSIRPKEMMPYDFSRENYSHLGYVAEGVTTYFGDHYLWRSGFFDDSEFLKILESSIDRHVLNPGRFNLSVAESSFETWLDGYVRGIPWRKVSIYNEGMLVAIMCDLMIIRNTNGSNNLDDVMLDMYHNFGKHGIGYTRRDYQNSLESIGGVSFEEIFQKYYYGVEDYIPRLKEELSYAGIELMWSQQKRMYSRLFGFVMDDQFQIVLIEPNSPSDVSGLWIGDKILSVNDKKIDKDVDQNMQDEIRVKLESKGVVKEVLLKTNGQEYFQKCVLTQDKSGQNSFFKAWKREA